MHDDASRQAAQEAFRRHREERIARQARDVERFVAAMNASGAPGARLLPDGEPKPRRFSRLRLDQRLGWEVPERKPDVVYRGGPAVVSTSALVYTTTEDGGVWLPPEEYLLMFTETALHHTENLARVMLENGVSASDLPASPAESALE